MESGSRHDESAGPSEKSPSGRFALVLGAVVFTTLLGAAVLAPAAATALEALLDGPEVRFSRVFDRLAIVILLVAAIVLRRELGLARVAEYWRAESWSRRGRWAGLGLAASLVPALLVMGPAIESSALLSAGRTALEAAEKMVVALPTALLVGLVEESFFRVVVFRGLAATWRWPLAAAVASAFYSVVHFLSPREDFALAGASPAEGLRYLGTVFARLVDPITLPAVLGLFLIGVLLCLALQRRGSLAFVVGLHAGYFLAAKAAIRLTSLPPELAAGESMVKRELLIGSPWLWLAIAATGVAAFLMTGRRFRVDSRGRGGRTP